MLRHEAAYLEGMAEGLAESQHQELVAQAEGCRARARVLRRAAAQLENLEQGDLRPRDHVATVANVDYEAHALATSAGRSQDPLIQAANLAGMTLRALADRVGKSHQLLSMARRGQRTISREVAESIEKLTGFAATPANWPAGIV